MGITPNFDRATMITQLQSPNIPVLVAIGESSPSKSKAEMVALAEVTNETSCTLPGTLGLHEEYPHELHGTLIPFLMTI
jgi:hypothetical protein